MNKKEILYSRITKHGQDLKAVFNLDRDIDPVKLCKRLLRLETKAHKLAVDFCNGVIDQLEWDKKADQILTKVETILKNKKVLFLNGDARGYALKIDDEYLKNNNFNIHRDWGGYGIIAPDFREYDKRLVDKYQVI
tara:strand:+ start:276 stop:683 length:408 start_codon:yes stop_codon:yes gene_type:complete